LPLNLERETTCFRKNPKARRYAKSPQKLAFRTGWWYTYPSEKSESSWDDDIPNIWKNKIHVPNHQPGNKCHSESMNSTDSAA